MTDRIETAGSASNGVPAHGAAVHDLGCEPGEGETLMNGLRFGKDAELPPAADADEEPMVVRSVRMPLALDRRLKAAARARGVSASQLLREWAELELAALENDQPISRADALRALATVRPLGAA